MTPVHVNIASDESEGHSIHHMLPPVGVGLGLSREIRIHHDWKAGKSTHKMAPRVLHKGQPIVQSGHDCGAWIPDLAPPQIGYANGALPLIMVASSRKVMFGASTVVAQKVAVGCALSTRFPMLSCGTPVSLPLSWPIANTSNTVLVGMTAADIQRGWEDIEDAIAVDIATTMLSFAGMPMPEILDAFGFANVDPVKSLVGSLVGLRRSVKRSIASGGTEPIVVKVSLGGGAGGASAEVSVTPATGEVGMGGEITAGPLGVNESAKGPLWTPPAPDVPPDLFD